MQVANRQTEYLAAALDCQKEKQHCQKAKQAGANAGCQQLQKKCLKVSSANCLKVLVGK